MNLLPDVATQLRKILLMWCRPQGSSTNDFMQIYTIFDPLSPSSHYLLLRSHYCRYKIIDPLPPKTVTSFMDDTLLIQDVDCLQIATLTTTTDNWRSKAILFLTLRLYFDPDFRSFLLPEIRHFFACNFRVQHST